MPRRRRNRGPFPGAQGRDSIVPSIEVSSLPAYRPVQVKSYDGDSWAGSFGATEIILPDYYRLRTRSRQLYRTNLYAQALVNRLVTSIVNTGLHLESRPEEGLLGLKADALSEWSEDVETKFELWRNDPTLCDHTEQQTFGAIQSTAKRESLVAGDVLVVLRQDRSTGLPRVQLVSGDSVQSPLKAPQGVRIKHGVELDAHGKHVAYWIVQENPAGGLPQSVRLPAWGEKSKKRLAWLVYGEEKLYDDVRGMPILSSLLNSLNDIRRYREAALRKAEINAKFALSLERTEDKPSSASYSKAAHRKGVEQIVATDGTVRRFAVEEHIPGAVIQTLEKGETLKAHGSQGTDEKFGPFEEAITQAMAFAKEMPPEILRLSFSSNYSASRAASAEFDMLLHKERETFGSSFCVPVYVEWLEAMTINQQVDAPGLLEARRNPREWVKYSAWVSSDWSGHVKGAIDLPKQANGYTILVEQGVCTRDRMAREITGMKFSKVVKQLKRENEMLAEAMRPIVELNAPKAPPAEELFKTDEQDEDRPSEEDEEEPDGLAH